MRELAWVLQALILTAGIHLFLRFVRTTRGIRLIRGLFVTVLVGVVSNLLINFVGVRCVVGSGGDQIKGGKAGKVVQ